MRGSVAWLALSPFLAVASLMGQETPGRANEDRATSFLANVRKYVIQIPKNGTQLTLNEKSLLNWTNPVRRQERGAIYVWTQGGRPLVISSAFTYELGDRVREKHEFHSLADVELIATYDGTLAWNPKSRGITWTDFQDAPRPASSHRTRLLQMRQLATRFRAVLTDPKDEKTELRLAPRPLLEYAAPKEGITDGVLLSFVVATDPEALLLIEAFDQQRDGMAAVGFRYAFARFHYWELTALEHDRKVWEAPLDRSHETNKIGDAENLGKTYNSFHPHADSQ